MMVFEDTRQTILATIAAILVLVAGGLAYRRLAPAWKGTGQQVIRLPVPLSSLPAELSGWSGQDVNIPQITQEYMRQNFADEFISRRYINRQKGMVVDLYTVYCASRPAEILGHRPGVCYPAHGWIHDRTDPIEVVTASGRRIPCQLHRFHTPLPNYQEIVVLSFYVVNGQLTTHEQSFTGLIDRGPNIDGDPARYVAQVQISSGLESAVRQAAADLMDAILGLLPDKYGQVKGSPGS
ncbi:MAG: EpsI family protein [Sedimentisphaerales bacterium]|jgi:EpsI family protein|nr:EpsI family protein [Sedimentisphaerales bacterium]